LQDTAAGRQIDADGSLSTELEAQPRSGDPDTTGVVWGTCAEISMLGALGCGETLVRLVMQQLQATTAYKFVVLQATKDSMGFYERMGFVRVGAVARYNYRKSGSGTHDSCSACQFKSFSPTAHPNHNEPWTGTRDSCSDTSLCSHLADTGGKGEIVGYRHWLGTDDSIERSDRASYMMAARLSPTKKAPHCNCSHKSKGLATGECLSCAYCNKVRAPRNSVIQGTRRSQGVLEERTIGRRRATQRMNSTRSNSGTSTRITTSTFLTQRRGWGLGWGRSCSIARASPAGRAWAISTRGSAPPARSTERPT
jgi:hypothetical protein